MLDAEALARIKERSDVATPGPWMLWEGYGSAESAHVAVIGPPAISVLRSENGTRDMEGRMADFEFIAHARTDIPALLDALDAAERRAVAAEKALEQERAAQMALDMSSQIWKK